MTTEEDHPAVVSRRRFLGWLGAATTLGAMGALGAGCTGPDRAGVARTARPGAAKPGTFKTGTDGAATDGAAHATSGVALSDGLRLPTAAWVQAENAQAGTIDWVVTGHQVNHAIEGFANRVSANGTDTVTLYVNTVAPTFHVEAYRMGWYQGLGGRLIWRSHAAQGVRQPAATFAPGTNMVECHWSPSVSFRPAAWPPGDYLLKLVGSGGQQQYVPFTLRDDASRAAFVIQNSVTTWQAYNLWGGYSLYLGATSGGGQTYSNRSRVVSFDRPYPLDWANGASDFIGNELPLVYMAERLGLDVTYATDIDLHQRPGLLLRRRALVSLGHDEYWSATMRAGATAARDAGVNLAFLGANACYRHIRLQPSPTGPDRHQVCYKDPSEDPEYGRDNASVTANWPDGPDPRPEDSLIGDTYMCNPVAASLVVADASSWLWAGTGLEDGHPLGDLVGSEYDGYAPSPTSPTNVQILAHSPLTCRGRPGYSDATWYTVPGGGGVFASGTNRWVYGLSDTTAFPSNIVPAAVPGVTAPLLRATQNLLAVIGAGPAGRAHPSVPNWCQYYSGSGPAPMLPSGD